MISLVEFLVGFSLMVAVSAVFTVATIAAYYLAEWLGWQFRRGSLAREAKGDLLRADVRAERARMLADVPVDA